MRLCEEHRLGGIRDGNPHECVGCAFEALRRENVRLREAMQELQEMMGPKGREMFVMLGPRMFGAVLRVVDKALAGG